MPDSKRPDRKLERKLRRSVNRPAFVAGAAARAAGRPIWVNPRVGIPARAWARGWKTKGER
jgi:hypothetical protein